MFEGFDRKRVATAGAEINFVVGGNGPPLLLLHGYPQTHAMWHRVAPALAERFTVVATDLRGYGDSSKPPSGDDFENYSKRAMAQDQVEVVASDITGEGVVRGHIPGLDGIEVIGMHVDQALGVQAHLHEGVDLRDRLTSTLRFRTSKVTVPVNDLALQVRFIDDVKLDDAEGAHPCCCEIHQRR